MKKNKDNLGSDFVAAFETGQVVLRKQICNYYLNTSIKIERNDFLKVLKEKSFTEDSSVGYYRITILLKYNPEKPTKLLFKVYTFKKKYFLKNEKITAKTTTEIFTFSFDKIRNHISFSVFNKGKKGGVKFRTNNFLKKDPEIDLLIEKIFSDSVYEFYSVISEELGLDLDFLDHRILQVFNNKFTAFLNYFLLSKRGYDFSDISNSCYTNFGVRHFSENIKYLKPGNNFNDFINEIIPFKESINKEILLYDPKFKNVFNSYNVNKIRYIKALFDIEVIDIRLSMISDRMSNIKDYDNNYFYLLKKAGYNFNDIISIGEVNLSRYVKVVHYFSQLEIPLNVLIKDIVAYGDDFDVLISRIQHFLVRNTMNRCNSSKIFTKLKNAEFKFSYNPNYSLVAPYFKMCDEHHILFDVWTNDDEFLGVVAFNSFENVHFFQVKKMNHVKNNSVNAVILKKFRSTKILESIDFTVIVNKIKLKEFLNKHLTDRYTQLIKL